jgi:hypothetical protein
MQGDGTIGLVGKFSCFLTTVLRPADDAEARAIIQRTPGVTYLQDSEVVIEGLRIYG